MRKFKNVNDLVNTLKPDYPVYCVRPEAIRTSTEYFRTCLGRHKSRCGLAKWREVVEPAVVALLLKEAGS